VRRDEKVFGFVLDDVARTGLNAVALDAERSDVQIDVRPPESGDLTSPQPIQRQIPQVPVAVRAKATLVKLRELGYVAINYEKYMKAISPWGAADAIADTKRGVKRALASDRLSSQQNSTL
jgi:hypothetical protein